MIKKGYQLQITSSENDGDNYNTITLDGLEKDDVEFYINFLKVVRYMEFENRYESDITDTEAEKFKDELLEIYDGNIPEKFNECYSDNIYEISQKLLGYSECYTTRVYESHQVYYFPEDIADITNEFDSIKKRW